MRPEDVGGAGIMLSAKTVFAFKSGATNAAGRSKPGGTIFILRPDPQLQQPVTSGTEMIGFFKQAEQT